MDLWDAARGTGLAALLVLTASLVLGVRTVPGVGRPGFVGAGLHRTLGVAGLALVVAHVALVVLDGYAPVGWVDGVVPFATDYRRLWTGVGTLAFDVMLVAALTSWRRVRPAYRVWKALHVASWACWPLAVAHGVADGTDTRARWVLGLTAACVAAVGLAAGLRIAGAVPVSGRTSGAPAGPDRWQTGGLGAGGVSPRGGIAAAGAVVSVGALLGLAAAGPLTSGWAAEAGTPTGLVGGRPQQLQAGSYAVAGKLDERLELNAATQRAREVLTAALPGGRTLQVVLEGPAFETGLDLRQSRAAVLDGKGVALAVGEVTAATREGYRLRLGERTATLSVKVEGITAWSGRLVIA